MRELVYNRSKAVAYGARWSFSRNPVYYDFDPLGGDCTNFVSQCLFAGAGVMNNTPVFGWYYHGLNDRSPSWTGVEYLYDFLVTNTGVGPYGYEVGENEILPGDVIQLGDGRRFYHSLLVIENSPVIRVAAHTGDAYGKHLSAYSYTMARMLHIAGVRGL